MRMRLGASVGAGVAVRSRPAFAHAVRCQSEAAVPHFRALEKLEEQKKLKQDNGNEGLYDHPLAHPVWTRAELEENIRQEHHPPKTPKEKLAYGSIQVIRFLFDIFSGYSFGRLNEKKLVSTRCRCRCSASLNRPSHLTPSPSHLFLPPDSTHSLS